MPHVQALDIDDSLHRAQHDGDTADTCNQRRPPVTNAHRSVRDEGSEPGAKHTDNNDNPNERQQPNELQGHVGPPNHQQSISGAEVHDAAVPHIRQYPARLVIDDVVAAAQSCFSQ